MTATSTTRTSVHSAHRPYHRSRRQWLVPAGLIALGLIPVLAGALRLTELASGGAVTETNARFFGSPAPVVIHIVSSTVFCLGGAFQFVPALRRRRRWHRIAGWMLAPMGLASAFSGMWMGVFYELPDHDGLALQFVRLLFGALMVTSILIAIQAIVRRDFMKHGDWMTRAYALGLAAGTQALVLTATGLVLDTDDQVVRVLGMASSWVMNLAVAELVIWRRRARRGRRRASDPGPAKAPFGTVQRPGASTRADAELDHDGMMRAAVYHRFGGPEVVAVESIVKPEPGAAELLIRVQSSTVSVADHRARSRDIPSGLRLLAGFSIGFRRPRRPVLGMDLAGVVEAVGAEVTRFAPGDEVIAMLGPAYGGHAEYAIVRADGPVARKPRNVGFDEAVAIVFGGITARGFLNQVSIQPGTTVLVNGASGAVGSAGVQLAKHLGAEVTAVTSGLNRELVNGLGADHVIDYTLEDFTAGGRTYDVVMDCVGNIPFARLSAVTRPGGAVLHVVSDFAAVTLSSWRSRRAGKLFAAMVGMYRAEDLDHLVSLTQSGNYRPVIDRTYELGEIVDAHRYVDAGHKRGNVILRLSAASAGSRI